MQREEENQPDLIPAAGMGITIQVGSDRYPGTIESATGARFTFRRDRFTRADKNGQSEDQRWICTPDPRAELERAHRHGNRWYTGTRRTGRSIVYLGIRDPYQDPSF